MGTVRINCKTNEEWRKERANSIGASAVGVLFGESHWDTPMTLAEKMRKELAGEFNYDETYPMELGHALEPGVASLFQKRTGLNVIKASSCEYLVRREDAPFMHCSPDRTYWIDSNGCKHGKNAEANKGILECKTITSLTPLEEVPLSWEFQLQVQLGICGCKEGYLAWLCLGCGKKEGFGYRRYEFDPELFAAAVEVCRDFWTRCVVGGETPEPVNAADVARRYPNHVAGKTITASQEIEEAIQDLRNLKQTEKDLKNEIEEVTDKIKMAFTDEEAIIAATGGVLATYKASSPRVTIDSKKLKEEYPEAYDRCSKVGSSSRTLLIK